MTDNQNPLLDDVQRYRQLQTDYWALDEQIDEFIKQRGGSGIDEMSVSALAHYRELSRQRDEMLNEMRILEQQLNLSDEA